VIVPPIPAPPAPFPLITASSATSAFVAPGVVRGTYRLSTSAGPLVINVVAVDLHEPTLRLDAVVAQDHLISQGETVSSMAVRSGAVAGVNADYFDIGQTNQPLNVVVRAGELWRTPSTRAAITVARDRSVRFGSVRFSGSARYGAVQMPLTGIGIWPPQGGASLLLPSYGAVRPAPGVRVATLLEQPQQPGQGVRYRVTRVADADGSAPLLPPLLAFGPAALALGPLPAPGDALTLDAALDPALDSLTCAVGGGPLLIAGGAAVEDPNAPAPEERDRRFPVSGAASLRDGTLLLVAVDGRSPTLSVGLTRPEFAALLLGLGASDGLAFDSGGSATLVARVLGDESASVLNVPSDGVERPVADGLFIYSDAPRGRRPHLIVRPEHFSALGGITLTLHGALVDDAGHRIGAAAFEPLQTAREPGSHSAEVRERDGNRSATVSYDVVSGLARLSIQPQDVDLQPGASLRLHASGNTADGTQVELGDAVHWHVERGGTLSADRGTISADGTFVAASHNAVVVAEAAGVRARLIVNVGSSEVDLPLFRDPLGARWHFSALPREAPGGVTLTPAGELLLQYDFGGSERAAYARGDVPLPGAPLALAFDVRGDASGVALRVAVSNRFGEQRALTLVKRVDWTGWRRVEVSLPPDVNPPVVLLSLYAVPSLGGVPARGAGTIAFRHPVGTLAGTP
jgi:hypothetical protein